LVIKYPWYCAACDASRAVFRGHGGQRQQVVQHATRCWQLHEEATVSHTKRHALPVSLLYPKVSDKSRANSCNTNCTRMHRIGLDCACDQSETYFFWLIVSGIQLSRTDFIIMDPHGSKQTPAHTNQCTTNATHTPTQRARGSHPHTIQCYGHSVHLKPCCRQPPHYHLNATHRASSLYSMLAQLS
jgi:hypothetical protein